MAVSQETDLRPDIYGGADPRALPAYPIAEASHYLNLPESTLRSWVCGRNYPASDGLRRSPPLIELPQPQPSITQLSFTNVVEAHVLSSIRREHRVSMSNVRRALDHLEERGAGPHPLANEWFMTDGVDLFVEDYGELVSLTEQGQVVLKEVIQVYLDRIERDERGLAAKLHPIARTGDLAAPKAVEMNPRVSFGRPVLKGTGTPTSILAERFKAGETIRDLARECHCDEGDIEEVLRFELPLAA